MVEVYNAAGRRVSVARLRQAQQARVARALISVATFAALNPYWGKRAYLQLGRGKVFCRYSSDQGTSTFNIVK